MTTNNSEVQRLNSYLQQWLSIQKDYYMQLAGSHLHEADRNTN